MRGAAASDDATTCASNASEACARDGDGLAPALVPAPAPDSAATKEDTGPGRFSTAPHRVCSSAAVSARARGASNTAAIGSTDSSAARLLWGDLERAGGSGSSSSLPTSRSRSRSLERPRGAPAPAPAPAPAALGWIRGPVGLLRISSIWAACAAATSLRVLSDSKGPRRDVAFLTGAACLRDILMGILRVYESLQVLIVTNETHSFHGAGSIDRNGLGSSTSGCPRRVQPTSKAAMNRVEIHRPTNRTMNRMPRPSGPVSVRAVL